MRNSGWMVGLVMGTLAMGIAGCGDEDTTPADAAPAAADDGFALDKLDGQWIRIDGNRGDHTHRFAFHRSGGATELWYTNGGFTKRRLAGELRKSDWKFTEVLDADEEARWKQGTRDKARLYVKPKPASGGLQITEVVVQSKGDGESEKPKGGFQEYVPFPEATPFTFRPCDGPLFLGPAASDPAEAAKQVKEEGGPFPGHALGKAFAAFTDAAADGDSPAPTTWICSSTTAPPRMRTVPSRRRCLLARWPTVAGLGSSKPGMRRFRATITSRSSGTVRAVTGLGSSSGCSASRPFWSRRAPDGWGGLAASVGSVWGAS